MKTIIPVKNPAGYPGGVFIYYGVKKPFFIIATFQSGHVSPATLP